MNMEQKCPVCSGPVVLQEERSSGLFTTFTIGAVAFWVSCSKCSLVGPVRASVKEAHEAFGLIFGLRKEDPV
jgi:hypothetical protein